MQVLKFSKQILLRVFVYLILCGGLGLSATCLGIAALYTGLLLKVAVKNRFFSVLYHKIFHLSSDETYSGLPHKEQ